MDNHRVTQLFCLFLVIWNTAKALQLDKKDGGYTDIVIKISNSVPEDSCPKILSNIKKLFNEGSHALHEATHGRVYFKAATVVVPNHWRDGKCQTTIREPNGASPYRKPDIRIDPHRHPIYGDAAYTQQSRGCGQPGDVTVFPLKFFLAWNETWETWGDPAKVLVHEWAKLRYGVFEEQGYPGDPLFPHFYTLPDGKLLPTGTVNDEVKGRWLDGEGRTCDPRRAGNTDNSCRFTVDSNMAGNSHVTCSLGYLYFLPSVKTFCDRGASLPAGPTKQNILCDGRTASEVIEAHEDFSYPSFESSSRGKKNINSLQEVQVKLEPEISIVREPSEKFILILETSSSMDDQGQWKWINKAAQKFIRFDLPLNSHMAIVTFSNASKIEHPLAQIFSDDIRSRLADTIPDKYHLSRGVASNCLLCAVKKSINDVLRNNMAGAHMVFITRGSMDTLNFSDEKEIIELVNHYSIRVSSITVPETNKQTYSFYDSIAQRSGGISRIVARDTTSSVAMYMDLMKAFSLLLPTNVPPVIVHERLIDMSRDQLSTSGTFIVDQTLGRDTRFGIYVVGGEDHFIRSVAFTDADSTVYGPYGSMSSLNDIINLKTVNYPVGQIPPFDNPDLLGKPWTYTIEWYEGGKVNQKSAVRITSRPRFGDDDIKIDVWTNTDSSADVIHVQRPLAVYAQIIKGSSPVLRADVTLEIAMTLTNGSDIVTTTKLYDNGNGDADLVAGDGIYSRFLTRYYGPGRYAFTVHVTDGEDAAFTVRATRDSDASATSTSSCCGSRVVIEKEDRNPAGRFVRSQVGPIVHLFTVPSSDGSPGSDGMPPARITDFKLDVLADGSQVLATWTAPGDDFDVGTVTGYRIVVSDNISALIDPDMAKVTLVAFQQPDEAGKQTSYQVSVVEALESKTSYFNKDIFLAIVAFDEQNNEGKLSNMVTLHLDGSAYPEVPGVHPVSAQPEGESTEAVLIGALCGSLVIVAICLWVAIFYFRRRRVSTKSGGVTANLVSGGGDLETSTENAASSTTTAEDIKSNQRTTFTTTIAPMPRPPGFEEDDGSTPIYWSASQLLAHQEAMNRQQQLDPIREEFSDEVDDDVYAQGLANYGYHMANQLNVVTSTPSSNHMWRGYSEDNILVSDSLLANNSSRLYTYGHYDPSIHEPVYTGYSPEISIYGTSTMSRSNKVPPKIPPKPSLNALLGIGDAGASPQLHHQPIYGSSSQILDVYGTASKRNITHV